MQETEKLASSDSSGNAIILPSHLLRRLAGASLFYPCSGDDLAFPLQIFHPYFSDFWFVDVGYFTSAGSADQGKNVLNNRDYSFLIKEVTIQDDPLPPGECEDDDKYRGVLPRLRTETYRHTTSGRHLRIHRYRRRAPSVLRLLKDSIGVFFYRGDSDDGGGSKTLWLTPHFKHGKPNQRPSLIEEVIDRMVDGGLVVTDGSNCHPKINPSKINPYSEFGKFRSKSVDPNTAWQLVKAFTNERGDQFTCVGHVGRHYESPVLVWQVRKAHRR
jgi:hypothetical protein